jgi:hypothetical protein
MQAQPWLQTIQPVSPTVYTTSAISSANNLIIQETLHIRIH